MKLLLTVLLIVAALIVLDASNRWRRRYGRVSGRYPASGDATDEDIVRLIRAGRKLSAIKLYREIHRVDLTTAKRAIDRMSDGLDGGR